MSYLIDRYLQQLSEKHGNSIEVDTFCRVILKYNHFNATHYYEMLQLAKANPSTIIDWKKKNAEYKMYDDCRIRTLSIQNFRKFKSKDNHPYILNLTKDNGSGNSECASLFLVGKNGTGKTSIFTALEFVFGISKISAMELRGIKDITHFLPYGDMSISDIKIEVELNSENKKGGKKYAIFNTAGLNCLTDMSSFFCSEKDIRDIYRQHNLKDIYINNIGLQEIKGLIDELDEDLKIQINNEQILPQSRHKTYSLETLQTDILRISCQGYGIYKNFIGQIGALQNVIKSTTINSDKKLNVYQKITNNKDAILKVVDCIGNSQRLKELQYFENNLSKLQNYSRLTKLKRTNLLLMSGDIAKLIDFGLFIEEIKSYLTELLSPFQKTNVNSSRELNRVARVALENVIRRNDSEIKTQIMKKNQEAQHFITDEEISRNVQGFRNTLYELFEQECMDFFISCNDLVLPILRDFTRLDKYNIGENISMIEKDGGYFAEITNADISKNFKTRPHLYYNSFRYKLFAISVKLSLALVMMKRNNMIAPIIIDDVFTASDFDNTVNIDVFFSILFEAFTKITNQDANKLQIILFTHDEVVINGLKEVYDSLNNNNLKFITGRLLNTAEIEKTDLDENTNSYNLYERFM